MNNISLFYLSIILSLVVLPAYAEDIRTPDPEFDEILSRDIADLTVTSVAKRSQRLSDTAAAVYVITQEELRRAGIYRIPDALRLVPGMQVARLSSDRWAVASRGFNNSLNNKLLVLIDGRAIYTPVFSGVYWGDQSTAINDIDRIEVIRGPGASLYGANAVNGVINIITKSAEDTQGNMVSAAATAKGNGVYEARHGGQTQGGSYYRVYGRYVDNSNWYRGRTGFRMDGHLGDGDKYTLVGDAYGGGQDATSRTPILVSPFIETTSSTDDSYGGDVLGRWTRKLSKDSELSLQAYLDYYARLELNSEQRVGTADVQLQHSMKLNKRNNFIWGGGGRLYYENLVGTFALSVKDRYAIHHILNAFLQDEYALVPNKLYLTAGSKFEYNDFTGLEIQPSARLAWHPTSSQTVWGAISRAVRTPSSIEEDISVLARVTPGPLTETRVFGNPNQESEELTAYELGHRIRITHDLSLDTALFFNDYDRLTTVAKPGPTFTGPNGDIILPLMFSNLGSGHTYGAEIAANWNVNDNWRLAGSYSYLKLDLEVTSGSVATLDATEKAAPRHQFALQSYYNLSSTLHWDNMLYVVDHLATPIGGYVRYDTRLAWLALPGLELSVIGKNLIDPHPEFASVPSNEIGRSIIGQVLWKF